MYILTTYKKGVYKEYEFQTLIELVRAAFELGTENPEPEDRWMNAQFHKEDISTYQKGNDE